MTDRVESHDENADVPERGQPIPRTAIAGVIVAALVFSVVMGRVYGVAVAVLVLAAGTLVGVVTFVFRMLQSIAEPADEDILAEIAPTDSDSRKITALRALKDIDYEHSLGNLSDEDHAELTARYREEAKVAMRAVDEERKGRRARAESLAALELERIRRAREEDEEEDDANEEESDRDEASAAEKKTCAGCATENDPDAKFCKTCGGTLAEEKG